MIPVITEKELNRLYTQVNTMYKLGRISQYGDVIIDSPEIKRKVLFRFDKDAGSKGAWFIHTEVEVNEEIW